MERDIQNFDPKAYALAVPGLLADQHRVLLSSLEAHLSGQTAPTLLVLGCGGEVLPYSFQYEDGALGESNIRRVHAMIREGSLMLADVTDSDESGLRRSHEVLAHCGFFHPGRFCFRRAGGDTFVPEGKMHLDAYPKSSVIFLQQNLRDPLLIADESVDAIDANLALHHVTQTRECMLRMYRELCRVLKPGGLLHLGEGNVDMNYSERKICRIGADLAEILGRDVIVQDARDPDYPYHYRITPSSQDSLLRAAPSREEADILLSAEGVVRLQPRESRVAFGPSPTNRRLMDELARRGFPQLLLMSDHVVLPLIDPLMECDRKGLIEGVDRYYKTITERCRRAYAGKRDEVVCATERGVCIERGYAARGIVEYYMGEPLILDALGKAGFEEVRVIRQSEPFYNVLARKPMR